MESSERRTRQRKALTAACLAQFIAGWTSTAWTVMTGTVLAQLLEPSARPELRTYGAVLLALHLAGLGVGATGGGLLADRSGRVRLLVWSLIAGAIAAMLAAIAFNVIVFGLTIVLSGLAIGAAWSASGSLVAETFSDGARGRAAGSMGAAFGMGALVALAVWITAAPSSMHVWRIVFAIGAVFALAAFWIRQAVVEPRRSIATMTARDIGFRHRRDGHPVSDDERRLMRFPLASVFTGSARTQRSVAALMVSLAVVSSWWLVTTSTPAFIGLLAGAEGSETVTWVVTTLFTLAAGSAIGAFVYGVLADRHGRLRVTVASLALTLVLSLLLWFTTRSASVQLVVAFALAVVAGGQGSWLVAWLPELYSTRMRASMMGLVYGVPRLLLAVAGLAGAGAFARSGALPVTITLAVACVIGIVAASRLPETRGLALPG